MFYSVYRVTNRVNGKIYIGVHITSNLDDGYMGSGLALKRAIEKHGLNNFDKEVIALCDSAEAMFNLEKELVDESFVARPDTYNIKLGGAGGWDFINREGLMFTDGWREARDRNFVLVQQGYRRWRETHDPEEHSRKVRESHAAFKPGYTNPFRGKSHSDATKKKISEANSISQRGSANSQYGTCWIMDPSSGFSKKVKKEDAQYWLERGWVRGRKTAKKAKISVQ